jgi:hypothetical protein
VTDKDGGFRVSGSYHRKDDGLCWKDGSLSRKDVGHDKGRPGTNKSGN